MRMRFYFFSLLKDSTSAKRDYLSETRAQKITNLGKLPSEQKRKIPKRQIKIKIIKENSQVKKENSQALKLLKYDNIF